MGIWPRLECVWSAHPQAGLALGEGEGCWVTAGAGREGAQSLPASCSEQWEGLLQTARRVKRKCERSLLSWGTGTIATDLLPVGSSLGLSHHHPFLYVPEDEGLQPITTCP